MSVHRESEVALTHAILREHFGPGAWKLAPAKQGRGAGAYVARSERHSVFVKWDVDGLALRRLSDLGIVPTVVAVARHGDRPYIIQRYVEGTHPDRSWLGQHLAGIATRIRTYQQDEELVRTLSPRRKLGHVNAVSDALTDIRAAFNHAQPPIFHSGRVIESLARWQKQGQRVPAGPIVPTHLDPNATNFLLSHDRVYLIDWDEVTLSDPMRDIGPFLWWYIPRQKWHEFFTVYGMEMTDEAVRRVYWWAAHRSISVALWVAGHVDEAAGAEDFLIDFTAATAGDPNPH